MSVFLLKVLYYSVDAPDVPINLTDDINLDSGRGLDIKNNVVNITLKNPARDIDSNGKLTNKYITEGGNILFKEDDQIKVFMTYTDDMAVVESSVWERTNISEPSSDYLKGVYYVTDIDMPHTIKSNPIKLKCADKASILFNRLLAKAFIADDALTAPQIIQKVIRFSSENDDGVYTGDGEDSGVKYDVDARLESDGGFIQDTRRSTKEDGTTNTDTDFPVISLAKVWKPVYDWIGELSEIENLNTSAELSSDLVYGQPFLFWVDEDNKFHWTETNDDLTDDDSITVGVTKNIISHKLAKSIFDVINFIVFRGGEDFFGNGTLDYEIDTTTNINKLKMRVIPMTDIAKTLIRDEIARGNIVEDTTGTLTFNGILYSRKDGSIESTWVKGETYDTDSEYNDALREKIFSEGRAKAQTLLSGLGSARFKGTVEMKGRHTTVGNLIEFTDQSVGINKEKIRIKSVRDNVNKTGWVTTWTLEQDSEAIVEAT